MANCNRVLLFIVFLSVFLIPLNKASAVGPTVSEIRVADVTTRSFSVIWIADETNTASLLVYNADCSMPVITVPGEGANNNVIKATVIGLEPATTYCFQTETTSTITLETTTSTQQLVTTESQTTRTYCTTIDGTIIDCPVLADTSVLKKPFGNDVIVHPIYNSDFTPGTGSILLLSVEGVSSSPVSARVGDGGITSPETLSDLNNLFSSATRENLNLSGGERLRLTEVRGANGCTIDRWRKTPIDNDLVEVKQPGACFTPADINCDDIVEIGDIILDIQGYLTFSGDYCFNTDLDQNGDGMVEIGDIILIIGQYLATNY